MSVRIATPTKDDIFKTVSASVSNVNNVFSIHNDNKADKIKAITTKMSTESISKGNARKMLTSRHKSSESSQNLSTVKKRRSLDKISGSKSQRKRSFRHGKDAIKLPTKFLLGGNITDPLNLNSMNDEVINKLLNAETPVSSPLPTPAHRKQVEVLIPPNINDPLNLNSDKAVDFNDLLPVKRSSTKKRKKHKRKRSSGAEGIVIDSSAPTSTASTSQPIRDFSTPLSVDVAEHLKANVEHPLSLNTKLKRVVDKIVSPAIPQHSPKPRRKRTISECSKNIDEEIVVETKQQRRDSGHKIRKQSSHSSLKPRQDKQNKIKNRDDKFIYGNYDRYYGKRNPEDETDKRLDYFQHAWFQDKDVLDIGCNIGHITISVAKQFEPRKIVGMDIDGKLINIARKNVKHYLSKKTLGGKAVPVSLPLTYGPLAAAAVPGKGSRPVFPNNINFVQGNYVLERDELLDLQKPEYDVIMALSITKWLHLNFGDAGLKRCFRRMYRQLKPGGKLVLEPQSYSSYKKKKNLTETISEHYARIEFRPERFTTYLLSHQVGFSQCERLETPHNKSQGFQRALYVYTKPDKEPPRGQSSDYRGVTPLMNIDCLHTPAFDSSAFTTPMYDALNLPSDYTRSPYGGQSLWEGGPTYCIAHTPIHTSVTDSHAMTNSPGHVAVSAGHVTPKTDRMTPTQSHMTHSPSRTTHSVSHVTDSPSHMTPVLSQVTPSTGHMTPDAGHVTCIGSSSSSSCDTCIFDCSQHSTSPSDSQTSDDVQETSVHVPQ